MTISTALRRVTAPATTPIGVGDAKAQCRVDGSDEDLYLTDLIESAVALVDAQGMLGRCMINQTWAEYFPNAPGEVRLTLGPFVSLTSVQYYDDTGVLQTATASDFETILKGDHVILRPKDGKTWPEADQRADAYKITYVAGFGTSATDVPAGLRHALRLMVSHWYQNREPAGQAMSAIPYMVEDIINAERVSWYGA
jgi:uncharacterized phiE125 gp8 family phage protein